MNSKPAVVTAPDYYTALDRIDALRAAGYETSLLQLEADRSGKAELVREAGPGDRATL